MELGKLMPISSDRIRIGDLARVRDSLKNQFFEVQMIDGVGNIYLRDESGGTIIDFLGNYVGYKRKWVERCGKLGAHPFGGLMLKEGSLVSLRSKSSGEDDEMSEAC